MRLDRARADGERCRDLAVSLPLDKEPQDVQFAGSVTGISALTKLLVGFTVGWASARFFLAGLGARTLVLLAAAAGDALLFEWLAAVFDVKAVGLSPMGLLWRATVNAGLGVALFELADRRLPREGPA